MIASTFKLDTWYETIQTSKALFGDENAISEMVESNTAQSGMLSLGLYVAWLVPVEQRTLAAEGSAVSITSVRTSWNPRIQIALAWQNGRTSK